MYYAATGTAPNRDLVFEFYTSRFGSASTIYRFQIVFSENAPNIVRYLYYQATDGAPSATIGTQGKFYQICYENLNVDSETNKF